MHNHQRIIKTKFLPDGLTMHNHQRGVGMVEVLVAMLLLGIGVLGFSILQVRAVEATGEASNRSQAMLILRGLAENVRVNRTAQANYPALVRSYVSFASGTSVSKDCVSLTYPNLCLASEVADYDSFKVAQSAFNRGIRVTMKDCPGVSAAPVKRQCLFAAWGKTTLDNTNTLPASTTVVSTDCMSSDGIYQPEATCVMMEAY